MNGEEGVHREPEGAPSLEQVLISLQKSFSRLSAASARETGQDPDQPRSMIVGDVDFELALSADMVPESDYLLVRPSGAISVKLTGTLRHDVVVSDPDEHEDEFEEGALLRPEGPRRGGWSPVPEDEAETVILEAQQRVDELARLARQRAEEMTRPATESEDG